MITLCPYTPKHEECIFPYIVSFFCAHHAQPEEVNPRATLNDWSGPDHEFFVILQENLPVGFLHISMRGPEVCWIEDIYVDTPWRRQGIAAQAIALMEETLRARNVEGVCMDVVPDNLPALRLYHRLGYDRLSLVTVRKEMQPFKTLRTETIGGLEFRVKQFED